MEHWFWNLRNRCLVIFKDDWDNTYEHSWQKTFHLGRARRLTKATGVGREVPPDVRKYADRGPRLGNDANHPMSTATSDLLQHFLSCPDASQSDSLLERLLSEYAEPVIQRIVSSKVRGPASEDVQHDVLVDLIARLHYVKRFGADTSIADFSAYSAVAAYHGCRQHYRQSFPERYRLANRVRYVLVRHPHFTIWKTSGGAWVCGKREQSIENTIHRPAARKTARLVETILEDISEPLPFELLLERLGENDDFRGTQYARQTSTVEARLIQREWIIELWAEIDRLPLPQRISLLLSMRDDDGGSGLILFPMLGVASLRQIAVRLAMPAEDLARLWGCLPLNDQRIGEHLRLDRQRVINLRKSARERLVRRAPRWS